MCFYEVSSVYVSPEDYEFALEHHKIRTHTNNWGDMFQAIKDQERFEPVAVGAASFFRVWRGHGH